MKPVEELATDHEWLGIRGKHPLDGLDIDPHELESVLAQLPPIEADIIQMSIWGMGQKAIGAFLGCSQANVSYRLRRAPVRLKVLRSRPSLAAIEEELAECGINERRRRLVTLVVELTTLTAAAKTLWPEKVAKTSMALTQYHYYQAVRRMRPGPIRDFLEAFTRGGARTMLKDPTKNHRRPGRPKKKAPEAHRSGDAPGTSGA